jgi:hypothetical protein
MPKYFRTSADSEISQLHISLSKDSYNEHLRNALFLLSADIKNLILKATLSFPLYAPDGNQFEPQYSFINQPYTGLYYRPDLSAFVATVLGVNTVAFGTAFTTLFVPLRAENGSITVPSYSFTNDTGAGLSYDASNNLLYLTLSSGQRLTLGKTRFLINGDPNSPNDGNVGITGVNPTISHIFAYNAAAGDTNIQGGRLDVSAGRGTGNQSVGGLGTPGLIRIRVCPDLASGTTLSSLQTAAAFEGRRWVIGGDNAAVPVTQNSGGSSPLACAVIGYRSTGTDVAGSNITVRSGEGTGAAAGSVINLQTPNVLASGSTQQTAVTRLTIDSTGVVVPSGQWEREPGNRKVTTAQFDKTNTTLADVTTLTVSVLAGRTYRFKAVLFVDTDATGGHKYAISGTATATRIKYEIKSLDNTALAYKIASRQTALGGNAGEASGTTYETIIEGTIVVNAAGTLTVQFAQNAASGTSSVLTDSTFIVEDMGS